MKPQNKLREIIWEITGRCNNHCTYCGSKQGWDEQIDENLIRRITNKIGEYLKDGEINISGGDPLLVTSQTHGYIVRLLKDKDNVVKLIMNPKSLAKNVHNDLFLKQMEDIIELYDIVGISVNNEEELDALQFIQLTNSKHVLITNFNIFNVWDYDKIEAVVKELKLSWQIQYTMEINSKSAIYENESAKKFLFEKIKKSRKEGIKLILADNLNCGLCGAGNMSCGILSNGDVVPCLSMRSWVANLQDVVQGNITKTSLEDIWINGFQDYRFHNFTCCKDICKAPYEETEEEVTLEIEKFKDREKEWDKEDNKKPKTPQQGTVVLYGVQLTPVYGTQIYPDNQIAMAYAVYTKPNE